MATDYNTLETLRAHHPAWRLLRAEHATLVASFLHRVFVEPNVRVMRESDLVEALEDELFKLRQQLGDHVFPKSGLSYLNDWASSEKAWIRKFYQLGSDEPYFDLTPSTEKAILWLATLADRSFVGTESRLLTLFDLLKQMTEGSETDPEKRLDELLRQRAQLDEEIARTRAGDFALIDGTALKDRFQQFVQLSRELLTDFREVEQNFRVLDRNVRERIALWEGSKGMLLEQIIGEQDAIGNSDQGKSFRAFWDFLMSSTRQEELSSRLNKVLALAPIASLKPDARTRRVHYDWLEAGEHTQRTVAQLSQQLRRFLDDQAWLENRRIMDILRGIEAKALAVRDHAPGDGFHEIAVSSVDIDLPMERPLYKPTLKPTLSDFVSDVSDLDIDATALYDQVVVDRARLHANIRLALSAGGQITLSDLLKRYPLQYGLAELLVYLQIASDSASATLDESMFDEVEWEITSEGHAEMQRRVRLPRVIFAR